MLFAAAITTGLALSDLIGYATPAAIAVGSIGTYFADRSVVNNYNKTDKKVLPKLREKLKGLVKTLTNKKEKDRAANQLNTQTIEKTSEIKIEKAPKNKNQKERTL